MKHSGNIDYSDWRVINHGNSQEKAPITIFHIKKSVWYNNCREIDDWFTDLDAEYNYGCYWGRSFSKDTEHTVGIWVSDSNLALWFSLRWAS